jgi:hypothetical protein
VGFTADNMVVVNDCIELRQSNGKRTSHIKGLQKMALLVSWPGKPSQFSNAPFHSSCSHAFLYHSQAPVINTPPAATTATESDVGRKEELNLR